LPKVCVFFVALALICSAQAQELPKNSQFDAAWAAYKMAVQSKDTAAMVQTASRALAIAEQDTVADENRLAILTLNYGKALLTAGDIDHAQNVLKLSIDRYEQAHGDDSPELIAALVELADAHASPGGGGKHAGYYKRAIKLSAAHNGEQSIRHANLLLRAGQNLRDGSRSIAGRKYLSAAIGVYSAQLGSDSLQVAEASYFLGKIAFSGQKFRNAEIHLETALAGFDGNSPVGRQRELLTRALLVQTYEYLGDSVKATEHCIAIGQMNTLGPDQKQKPLFRLAASYPIDMLAKRREGFVDVGFIVDEAGFVRKPVVLKNSGGPSFGTAALNAVKRFRYAPKFVDGNPVSTEHVRTRISFKLN